MVNVAKYSSPMDPMGLCEVQKKTFFFAEVRVCPEKCLTWPGVFLDDLDHFYSTRMSCGCTSRKWMFHHPYMGVSKNKGYPKMDGL